MAEDGLGEALLGAPVALTRQQVAEASGVPLQSARELWAAMGLPEVPDGVVAFTDRDVAALRAAAELAASGVVDPASLRIVARAMGQGLARLAEAQVDVFRASAAGLSAEQAREGALLSADDVLPRLELLTVHVWRRQFAAAVERSFAAAQQDGLPVLAVGFVDLVGFTRTSRESDAQELEQLLERFEAETSLRVTACGGRVVKTLGDEVMYVASTPAAVAEVALDTVAAHARDESLPEVRAGVAVGPVLQRLGDVFGEPVNLASRLTSEARPSSVLVDAQSARLLSDDPSYDLRPLHQRSVRGYRSLRPHLLRRASV